jgi:glutathione peroxidase
MKTYLIVCAVLLLAAVVVQAVDTIYSLPLRDIDGKSTSLKAYEGKVLLIVNVASKCGYTPQYRGLEALQQKYQGKGLTVLGFPCNQFGAQEPGTAEQIKQFCSSKYEVTFPLFEKIEVNGPKRHPLYSMLAGKDAPFPGDIRWNFTKFLVGRDGKVLKRFEPGVKPDSAEMVQAIESVLAGS